MATAFAAGGVVPGSPSGEVTLVAGETVAPCRLAERHAIQQVIDSGQRSDTVRADVLVDQEPANLLQLLTRPLLRRLRHTEESHQQGRHPGDGTR